MLLVQSLVTSWTIQNEYAYRNCCIWQVIFLTPKRSLLLTCSVDIKSMTLCLKQNQLESSKL